MNQIIERLLAGLLIPALDRLGTKYKTVIGIVLVSTTYLAHALSWPPIDTPLSWIGGATPYEWLMGIGGSVFGLGLVHKASKIPIGPNNPLPPSA